MQNHLPPGSPDLRETVMVLDDGLMTEALLTHGEIIPLEYEKLYSQDKTKSVQPIFSEETPFPRAYVIETLYSLGDYVFDIVHSFNKQFGNVDVYEEFYAK